MQVRELLLTEAQALLNVHALSSKHLVEHVRDLQGLPNVLCLQHEFRPTLHRLVQYRKQLQQHVIFFVVVL